MRDRSPSSTQLDLLAWCRPISSPESEGGPPPSVSPAGPTTAQSGPRRARVSRSRAPASVVASTTSATSGRSSSRSSASAALQSSLANRLRAATASLGSTLYTLTWKERATPSGLPICALRASVPRTSGSGSTSSPWPTATARDHKDGASAGTAPTNGLLGRAVWASPWPTPTVNDATGSQYSYAGGDHTKVCLKLPGAAQLVPSSWGTPTSKEPGDTADQAIARKVAAGMSPAVTALAHQVARWCPASWATPSATEAGGSIESYMIRKVRHAEAAGTGIGLTVLNKQAEAWCPDRATDTGPAPSGSPAPTGSRGQLNADFTR